MTDRRRHLIALLATLLLPVSAASADLAPGRAIVPLDGNTIVAKVFEPQIDGAVALPRGGALFLIEGSSNVELVQVTPQGTLDPTFASGGIASVSWPPDVTRGPLLRAPDGHLFVLGTADPAPGTDLRQRAVVRLNANGTVDNSFGNFGVVRTSVQVNCTCPEAGFVEPDGSLILVGSAGPSVGANTWVVAKLTPTGAPDPSFGVDGVATVGGPGTGGDDVVFGPGGTLVALGAATGAPSAARDRNLLVARLNANGTPDPTFHGGTPFPLPADAGAGDLVVRPDGSIVASDFGHAISVAADGTSTINKVHVGSGTAVTPLLGSPDGTVLALSGDTHVRAVAPDGTVGPSTMLDPGFGGFVGNTPPLRGSLLPLPHAPFDGHLLQLASGGFLGYGTVGLVDRGVAHPATPGHTSIAALGLVGFTPTLTPDVTFGAAATPLTVTAALGDNHRVYARHHRRLDIVVGLSAPGLIRVVVRAGGVIIAQRVAASLVTGPQTMVVSLTHAGAHYLAHHRQVTLRVSIAARDMIGNFGRATAVGPLTA